MFILNFLGKKLKFKQVGVAGWLECCLSHLGDAGLSPSHDNLWMPLGEYAALVRLCMTDGTKTGKSLKILVGTSLMDYTEPSHTKDM